MHLLSIYSS